MPQRQELQQIEIKDFTPGIFQGPDYVAFIPTPLGAATGFGTYRCYGLPNGGLAPLPALVPKYSVPTPDSPANYTIVGMQCIGQILTAAPVSGNPFEELHVDVQEDYAIGVASQFRWYRLKLADSPIVPETIYTIGGMSPSNGQHQGSSNVITRLQNPNSQPTLAKSWRDATATNNRLWFWPDPSAPGTLLPIIDTTQDHAGMLIAHQSRVLVLPFSSVPHGNASTFWIGNETINYTDPPLTSTMTSPHVLLGTENPFGYGAWGSISSGELILIKRYGGAILIEGDIFNPTVITLPGVTSTGEVTQKGTFSPAGLIYCSEHQGVFAWNGSNASELLSPQLDENVDFFLRDDTYFDPERGINTTHTLWGEWVVFLHNYIYNLRTKSWWNLEKTGTFNPNCVTSGITSRNLYAALGSYSAGATNQIAVANQNTLASNYSWMSQFLPLTVGKMVDVREIEIVVGRSVFAPAGQPTVKVTLYNQDAANVAETFNLLTTNADQPQRLRAPTSVQAFNMRVQIEADSGDPTVPAPIVYSIIIKYHDGPPVALT